MALRTWPSREEIIEHSELVFQDPRYVPQNLPRTWKDWKPSQAGVVTPFEIHFFSPGKNGGEPTLGVKTVDLFSVKGSKARLRQLLLDADSSVREPFSNCSRRTVPLIIEWPGYPGLRLDVYYINFSPNLTLIDLASQVTSAIRAQLASARGTEMIGNHKDPKWRVGPGNVDTNKVGFSRLWSTNGDTCFVDIYVER